MKVMFPRVLCLLWAGLLMAQTAADPSAAAQKALDSLLGQKFADLTPLLAPQARTAYSPAVLNKMGAEIKSYGAVEKTGEVSVRRLEAASVVTIPVKFADRTINFQFAVNPEGLVTAMSVTPAPPEWKRPPLQQPGEVPRTRCHHRHRPVEVARHPDGPRRQRSVPGRGVGA